MTHRCAPCGREFKTELEYLDHKCEKAEGAQPIDKEFLIRTTTPHYAKIKSAAIARGDIQKAKEKQKQK